MASEQPQSSSNHPSTPETHLGPDFFDQFFEVLPEPVILVNRDGHLVQVNSPAEELFGYSPGELQGREVEDLIPESARETHRRLRARYFDDPRLRPSGQGLQLYGRKRDGETFAVDISLRPLRLESGMHVLCVLRDVTERARIHGELRAAHDELDARVRQRTSELEAANTALHREIAERRKAQESLQQQVTYASLINRITRTMASNQNLQQVLDVVPEYLETHLGTDSASLYLIDASGEMAPMARGPRGQDLARQIRLGEGSVAVEQMGLQRCLRGEALYMPELSRMKSPVLKRLAAADIHTLMAVPLVAEDEVIGILTVSRRQPDGFSAAERDFLHTLADHVALAVYQARLLSDLKGAYEELKTTQEQVIQTERLRALGQLASGIAHDINNSLSAVMLFATIGLRRPNLDDALRHCLENVEKAATDATSTVSRLREFYRPREPMEAFETVNLNEIVQDVLMLTRAKWKDEPQARGIPIEIVIEGEARQVVQGHRSELREVLTNLVINSVDAMPRGGAITIRTRDLEDAVLVEVADNGIGMDENTRKRVFEPFFTTKGPQGTGLGMSVCWGVVQRHNGKIAVWSEFGRGTAVTIELPLGVSGSVRQARKEDTAGLRSLRILCADDEPLIREGLQTLLGHMGHRVVVACDGAEAIRLFGTDHFDVVITDLGMPGLSGHDVARLVKEASPPTPVILLTGWGEWQDAARPAHVDLVSRKPPTQRSLDQALRSVTQA